MGGTARIAATLVFSATVVAVAGSCSMYRKIFHPHAAPASSEPTASTRANYEAHGDRDCGVPPMGGPLERGEYGALSGCRCHLDQPDEPFTTRSQDCAGLPCTMDGCYVRECQSDGDCASGRCGIFAGEPRGYCASD